MPSILSAATAISLLLFYASTANAQSCAVALKTPTNIGCFSSSDPLVQQGSYTFQTGGYCQCQCATLGKAVFATTKGSDCYCGDLIPNQSSASSNSSCNSPCNGFGQDTCGGNGFWQVALTGTESSVGQEGGSASTSGSSGTPTANGGSTATSTHSPSVVTVGGQTIVVTASSTAKGSAQNSSGGGGSKAGIAVGVVVGVVLVAAIVGGIIFFLKQRKKRAVEEEFKRAASVNAFVAGKKSEASSTNDQRLDPSIMQHGRQSIGSIADERDFSRRILQVRNPDDV